MKNFNDTIGNRTRDLPACSAVPQPTAPPRAPIHREYRTENNETNSRMWGVEFEGEPSSRAKRANVVNFCSVNMEMNRKNLIRTFSLHKLTDSSKHKNPKITKCKLPFTFPDEDAWREERLNTQRYLLPLLLRLCNVVFNQTTKNRAITVCFSIQHLHRNYSNATFMIMLPDAS